MTLFLIKTTKIFVETYKILPKLHSLKYFNQFNPVLHAGYLNNAFYMERRAEISPIKVLSQKSWKHKSLARWLVYTKLCLKS